MAAELRVPIHVLAMGTGSSRRDVPVPISSWPVPLWTGVPLPKSAVADVAVLRLLDPSGKAIPAQFDVEARWVDGSAKWVLVSFARPAEEQFGAAKGPLTLTADASVPAPPAAQPVSVDVDTNSWIVRTGPMQMVLNRQGFAGFADVRLDMDADGRFVSDDLIVPEGGGIVAVDGDGKTYTSRLGRVGSVDLELPGPLHAAVALEGDLRGAAGESLLEYAARFHVFAGSSLVRVVLTVRNPRPAGRANDGARWVLGESGSVLLKGLDFVLPLRLPEGHRRVTLSSEPGRVIERIPLTGPMGVYQDSSGGENWFHQAHVNRDSVVPLRFRGYRLDYHGRQIDSGLRAEPWLDVADMRWAATVGVPAFWQNFPKSLGVDGDGTIRVGLWPDQFGDLHELQGGEQKTHEFWVYFRHRRPLKPAAQDAPARAKARRERIDRFAGLMPLPDEVMASCLRRPAVLPAGEAFAASGTIEPVIVPAEPGRFATYESVVAAAVRGKTNLLTDRELTDEYGWRHFGDTPARNEIDQTEGPFHGCHALSHYNNEYDLGLMMLLQAARQVPADPALARAWVDLAMAGLWHEADIDIYHTHDDPAPIYNGGTFTHTSHGVDAGRSTHRGSPHDEMWGRLDWEWRKGSTPEAGHLRTGGILHAWLLTGDGHLRDAADEVAELVSWKIRAGRFAQIDTPDRGGGNNLQILLDAYLLTREGFYLEDCRTLTDRLDFDAVVARRGGKMPEMSWNTAIFVRSLFRFIVTMGQEGQPAERLVRSHLAYAKAIREECLSEPGRRRRPGLGIPFPFLMAEVMTEAAELTADPVERDRFLAAAKTAFHASDSYVEADGTGRFVSSKATTIQLQGGGRYMRWAIENKAEE